MGIPDCKTNFILTSGQQRCVRQDECAISLVEYVPVKLRIVNLVVSHVFLVGKVLFSQDINCIVERQ